MPRSSSFGLAVALLLLTGELPVFPQSLATEGNIETDAQLVSRAASGTPPLVVLSTTLVDSLNADRVDGLEGADLALEADLQNVEAMLAALQDQVDQLGLARVPRTGQSESKLPKDDGDLQLGVTWPNPRFTDNGNGTVTDNLTGLIWLDDADCFGLQTWSSALAEAAALFDGCSDCGGTNMDCGLADGSIVGQWRMPNLRELQSLVHYGVFDPALPDTAGTSQWSENEPFSGVQSTFYWSSTAGAELGAWDVDMGSGDVSSNNIGSARLWPVRGGQ